MEKIGEVLTCFASTRPLTAALDEIQIFSQGWMAKAIADPSYPSEFRKRALVEKLKSLASVSRMLTRQKKKFELILDDLDKEARKIKDELFELEIPDIPPHVLIQFVNVVDEANHYFNFKEFVKSACRDIKPTPRPDEIYRTIFLNQKVLLPRFDRKFGELQVTRAANAVFWELDHEQHGKEDTKPRKDHALLDWIHNMVFRTRVKGYVMDYDPIVELKKMMKSEPFFFNRYFLNQQHPEECTETLTKDEALKEQEALTKEALNKYSHLVSLMNAKYKKTCSEKHASTSARNIEAALNHKLMIILAPTCARNKEALNENKFISTASEMDTKSKRPFVVTSDGMSPEKRKRL